MTVPTANPLEAYRKAKLRTARANRFGLEMGGGPGVKGKPVHRNTRSHPRPFTRTNEEGIRFRVEVSTSLKTDGKNVTGERAAFHVSDGNSIEQRNGLDLDGDGSMPSDKRAETTRRLVARFWPGYQPFIEPSRSRTGSYAWVRWRMPRVDPLLVNLVERIVNHELKERLHRKKPRFHFDALKGGAAYEIDNPHFDPEFAYGLIEKAVTEFEVEPSVWMKRRDAKHYLRDTGSKQIIADLPVRQRRIEKTRLECYEQKRAFYGIDFETGKVDPEARFPFDRRLEETWRHFGVLITDIANGQPERLAEATAWLNNKASSMTMLQFIAFTPDWVQTVIKQVRDGKLGHREAYRAYLSQNKGRAVKAAGPTSTTAPISSTPSAPASDHLPPLDQPVVLPAAGVDIACLRDPEAWSGYGAGARLALRDAAGDMTKVHHLAFAIYEQHGQATGFEDHDREKRWEDMGRAVEYWAATFDPKLAKARRGQAMDSLPYVKHLHAMARELDARISQFVLEHHCTHRPKSKTPITAPREVMLQVLAVVLAHTSHNIHVGNLRAVPCNNPLVGLRAENARRRLAKKKKLPSDEKHVAAALDILEATGLLTVTRKHHAQARQCRQRALGKAALRMQSMAWVIEVAGGREMVQVAPQVTEAELAAAFMPAWNRRVVLRKARNQSQRAADADAAAGAEEGAEARVWMTAAEEALVAAVVAAAPPYPFDNPSTPSLEEACAGDGAVREDAWQEEVIFGTKWSPDREVA